MPEPTPSSVDPVSDASANKPENAEVKAAARDPGVGGGASPRPRTEFERKLGMLSTMVQIAALVTGGIFAVVKFGLTDAPTLQKSFNVAGSLDWLPGNTDSSCIAEMDVTVTNNSKSTVTVLKVRGRAWYLDPPAAKKPIQHFEFTDFADRSEPADEFISLKGPLVQTFAPGESALYDFDWSIERREGKYALFKVEVFDQPDARDPLDWQYQWDLVCDTKSTNKDKNGPQVNSAPDPTRKLQRR